MAALAKVWTVDEVLALPEDGRRHELIDGVLLVNGVAVPGGDLGALDPAMTPSPTWTHQDAVAEMWRLLSAYLEKEGLGHARMSPADIPLTSGQIVQPDLFVVPMTSTGKRATSWEEVGALRLAVEVVSPSSARTDRVRKRALYQRARVPEYWIIDIDARLVERWTPGDDRPELLTDTIEWRPSGAVHGLPIDLVAYFAAVAGDSPRG